MEWRQSIIDCTNSRNDFCLLIVLQLLYLSDVCATYIIQFISSHSLNTRETIREEFDAFELANCQKYPLIAAQISQITLSLKFWTLNILLEKNKKIKRII